MKMTRAWSSLLLIAAALTRCGSPSPQTSSSSNWADCKTLTDCAANPAAVACKDGYCVDANGERVARITDAGTNDAFESGAGDSGGICGATNPVGDAGVSCVLEASDYDRSCTVDADCVGVGVGDACSLPCEVLCPSTAISVRAYAQYQADFAKTPVASCPDMVCFCPAFGSARCRNGLCETSFGEPQDSGTDARDAMSDADADADARAGLTCATSVQDYCSRDSLCIETWQTDPKAFCVLPPNVSIAENCGAYHIVRSMGVDTSVTYYYEVRDLVPWALVAIVAYGPIGGVQCAAGPSNFVEPSCDVSQFVAVSCTDQ